MIRKSKKLIKTAVAALTLCVALGHPGWALKSYAAKGWIAQLGRVADHTRYNCFKRKATGYRCRHQNNKAV